MNTSEPVGLASSTTSPQRLDGEQIREIIQPGEMAHAQGQQAA